MSASIASPAPIGARQYEGKNYAEVASDFVSCLADPCSAKISNLRPASDYKFWVRAIHESRLDAQFVEDSEAVSTEASITTKEIPGTLRPDNITGTSIVLRWTSLQPENPPTSISIQYKISGEENPWKDPTNASLDWSEKAVAIVISALRSATAYEYRFTAEYTGSIEYANQTIEFSENYFQSTQQFRTKPGTPSAPTNVKVVRESNEGGWIVTWSAPTSDGGSPITSYALEYRPDERAEWEIAERGLDGSVLSWTPPSPGFLAEDTQIRIRATNSEGFGAYAYSKQRHNHIFSFEGSKTSGIVWFFMCMLLILCILLIAGIAALYIYYNRKGANREMRRSEYSMDEIGTKKTALPPEVVNDLKSVPRISKNCLSLQRILGKGSFGEVYEGVAMNLPQSPNEKIRVAVKALKAGYTSSERLKFMKEAILMNNFDHPNIVKLIGVAFESEPYFLAIELMEGGDLLGFLRSSRPSDSLPSQLSIRELIDMMVDIGRGGRYLEVNQHVHRDLAARNCLISSRNSHSRITKIADFGLARDVYTSDYYRIHGDDFLPLRWLSPESIADGIFTSKSDVWSFGVTLWEILTLGQQPYVGKNNVQVINYVRGGNHLEKPPFCPHEIYKIIERTWTFAADERPSFSQLLPELEALRGNLAYQDDSPFPPTTASTIVSSFELSLESNVSSGGSHERSGSVRFDKSDNPSTKKQGRPSILRSLRKERSRLPSSKDGFDLRSIHSASLDSVPSHDTSKITDGQEHSFDNDAFISSDKFDQMLPKINIIQPSARHKVSITDSILNKQTASAASSTSSTSHVGDHSTSIRPARVSRV
ncbi:hypothetical protein AB6A40_002521 [Gnathostoma spinigerum]|uniref:receptor protein-tyrosine kinase n=1 Tax=Gnathostoma spinigerum TaxID=75299 RepID=A0ABD6EGK5_9BILA